MPNAIRIHRTGGPEALTFEPLELAPPGPGEVRLRHSYVGVNFIDTYYRTGLYPLPLPAVLGQEGAGRVAALGPSVTTLKVGDRVAYANLPGAWTEERNVPAERLVKLPDFVSDETAAAVMLKGMTAEYLLHRTFRVRPGDTSGLTLDGMGMASTDHSIIDHCSISWTQDEAFSSRGAKNITLQRTLISEALNVAGHKKYEQGKQHGYAASIGGDIGSFQNEFAVYGREGGRCLRRGCRGSVRRKVQGGRSTFYCPVCQR